MGRVYTKLKDKTEKLKRSCVIYKIPCTCGLSHVGQTSQYLRKRISQHTADGRPAGYLKEETTLARHHFDAEHTFKFDVSVLDSEPVYLKRTIGEMIFISLTDTVNFRTDTQRLGVAYNLLLDMYKNTVRGKPAT